MALYDTRFGLPQSVADYLNQGLPDIYQSIYNPPPATIGPITTMPVESTPLVDPLYPQTGGNQDGFSVYNPDPNRTRTQDNYSPYAYRQAAERNLIGTMGGALTGTQIPNTSTEVAKLMDMYPDYYQGKQLTGIPGAIQGYLKNSLAGQLIGRAASGIESLLPVNRRAILENELLGQGFQLNDIGQFVSDGGAAYKEDGSNIMAGYNAAKVTQETFDRRRAKAKAKMTPEGFLEFDKALTAAEEKILGKAKTMMDTIFDDKSLQKDPTYKSLDEKIKEGLLEGDDDDDDYEFDPTNPKEFFKLDPISRKKAITQEISNREAAREATKTAAAKKSAIAQETSNREAAREAAKAAAAKKSAIAQETSNRDAVREAAKAAAATRSRDLGSMRGGVGRGNGTGDRNSSGTGGGWGNSATGGGWCFDPNTFVQMADGSEKKIKEIQLGDNTKGGEVTGVFQFKAADEIHDYKGVTVAGSHYVKEDGRFIMVKDSPLSVKIDKIPVVYSLDTSGRRIFINDIEFADYNGDGIAKGFLANAGVDITGFDKEVLRQVENRLI